MSQSPVPPDSGRPTMRRRLSESRQLAASYKRENDRLIGRINRLRIEHGALAGDVESLSAALAAKSETLAKLDSALTAARKEVAEVRRSLRRMARV